MIREDGAGTRLSKKLAETATGEKPDTDTAAGSTGAGTAGVDLLRDIVRDAVRDEMRKQGAGAGEKDAGAEDAGAEDGKAHVILAPRRTAKDVGDDVELWTLLLDTLEFDG